MLFWVDAHEDFDEVAIVFDAQTGRMISAVIESMIAAKKSDHEHLMGDDGVEFLSRSPSGKTRAIPHLRLVFLDDDDPRVREREEVYPKYGGNLFFEANNMEPPSDDS